MLIEMIIGVAVVTPTTAVSLMCGESFYKNKRLTNLLKGEGNLREGRGVGRRGW